MRYFEMCGIAAVAACICSHAATAQCASRIEPASDKTLAYRNYGDRCEGLLRQPIAASARLSIVGVHGHAPSFEPGSGNPIIVSASGRGAQDLMIVIVSSRPRQYYRLDAHLAPSRRFVWKRDIVDHARVALTPGDIKGYACEGACDVDQPRLVPISISEGKPLPSDGIVIWMRAALDLKELFVTLQKKGAGKRIRDNEDVLEGRLLPAGRPKDIIEDLERGTYSIRATAVPAGGGAVDEMQATIVVP